MYFRRRRWLSSEQLRCVIWHKFPAVSEVLATFIIFAHCLKTIQPLGMFYMYLYSWRKRPLQLLNRKLAGTRAGLDVVAERKIPVFAKNQSLVFQPTDREEKMSDSKRSFPFVPKPRRPCVMVSTSCQLCVRSDDVILPSLFGFCTITSNIFLCCQILLP